MSLIYSPNFQFTFSLFDKVTYVTGSYRLTLQRTECKHFLKDSSFNSLQDRICLQNSLMGGGGCKPILSHPSNKSTIRFYMIKICHVFPANLDHWNHWCYCSSCELLDVLMSCPASPNTIIYSNALDFLTRHLIGYRQKFAIVYLAIYCRK